MDIQKEREAFLAHMRSIGSAGFMFELDDDGNFDDMSMTYAWSAWQAAKAQAVPEGFVLVLKEPYAYLIKHKFWQKSSDPEIFLAEDFLGDGGVEKDKLTVCIPLYLGDDEA